MLYFAEFSKKLESTWVDVITWCCRDTFTQLKYCTYKALHMKMYLQPLFKPYIVTECYQTL